MTNCCAYFHFKPDVEYTKYADKFKLVKYFINERVKLANKKHDLAFFHNINTRQNSPDILNDKELYALFPSRRKWIKLGKKGRKHLPPLERNKKIISLMFSNECKETKKEQWCIKLEKEICTISQKIMSKKQDCLTPPDIKLIPKSKDKYRPVSNFKREENIRIGIAAKYIRMKIDTLFLPCSYAFREKNKKPFASPTHHDAVEKLIEFRKEHEGKTIYVAECDIKKFFDIVNHKVAIKCLHRLLKEYPKTERNSFDRRALSVFNKYLKCYTYQHATDEAEKHSPNAKLDKLSYEELKKIYKQPEKIKYGIPQGGALSPIIANIILHYADKAIYKAYGERNTENLFYARYCDDMIIAHTNKETCLMLLEKYCETLKKLKLLVHEPEEFIKYNKKFYTTKSKQPYPWSAPTRDRSTVPWVSFVGYQVGHDGTIRVRQTSIEKEIAKQNKIACKVSKSINFQNNITKKTAPQIIYRLQGKLTSMAVGKRYKNSEKLAKGMCWAMGFKLLKKHPHDINQLKKLDKNREKMIAKVKSKIKSKVPNYSSQSQSSHGKNFNRFFGAPFSYYKGFNKDKK